MQGRCPLPPRKRPCLCHNKTSSQDNAEQFSAGITNLHARKTPQSGGAYFLNIASLKLSFTLSYSPNRLRTLLESG